MNTVLVAMTQPAMRVASPGEDMALGEQATVHLLPADAVMLYDRLIGHSESAARSKAPVCGIESYRGLLERFACATESEETLRI